MIISRRDLVLASAGMAGLLTSPRWAQAQVSGLPAIRFGNGLKSMSPVIINTVIGEGLGYNKAEGFRLEPLALGSNANVMVATDKGDCQIGIGVPSVLLPLYSKKEMPPLVSFYQYTYPYKWDVAVSPDSDIKTYADLKGKKIGVSDLGATDYPVTRNVLKSLSIDPDREAQWIAVGAGVQAGVALQRGAIDALAYFDTGFGQIEVAGIPLRYLERPKSLPLIGGQTLMARRDWLDANRTLATGFARSVAKASIYLTANPVAGAKAFLEMYPEVAPRGMAQADAIKQVVTAIGRRITLYQPPYANTKMGATNPDELKLEAEFVGLKIDDVAPLFTNTLIDDINTFDADAIRAAARAVKN